MTFGRQSVCFIFVALLGLSLPGCAEKSGESPVITALKSTTTGGCVLPLGWEFEGYAGFATQTMTLTFTTDRLGNDIATYLLNRSDATSPGGAGSWDGRITGLYLEERLDGKCWITGTWTDVDGSGGVEFEFDPAAETLDGKYWESATPGIQYIWKLNRK